MKSTAVIRFYKAVFLSKPSNGKKKREKGMAARELVINTQIKQAVHKGRQCNRAEFKHSRSHNPIHFVKNSRFFVFFLALIN